MPRRRLATAAALAAASALVLAGCASSGAGASDGRIQVVASTNVYAQIVEEIGGEFVDATAIVSSSAQDPHAFEPSARDQLAVKRADLIIENGGGYDAFVEALVEASGSTAPVITAAEFSHDWPGNDGHDAADAGADAAAGEEDHSDHAAGEQTDQAEDEHAEHEHVEGFNEHVWYDPHTMQHLAEEIARELSGLLPAEAATFDAAASTFAEGIAELETGLAAIDAAHAGAEVFATEPVPVYLLAAAGLENVTPEDFSEAVEEGQDVAPSTLLESLKLLRSGDIGAVIVNSQTGGAETTEVISEAEAQSIPVIEFSETLPDGQTYLSWMQANIDALAGALDS